jgi:bifunctional DNA primase/polymerase-like protein/AAA domain-containing protein/primase-like protein
MNETVINPLLTAALALAAQGIPVFPCKNAPGVEGQHKRPLTRYGFKDATTKANQIRRWWGKECPNALIGVPTGSRTGINVLDLDVKKGKNGIAHVPNYKDLSNCISRTGSGGIHIFFQGDNSVRNSADKIAPGVDVRGEGGYVIVPPSPGYEWLKGNLSLALPDFPDRFRPAPRQGEPTPNAEPQADIGRVRAALAVIPNDDIGWEDWNRVGMAIFAATGGSTDGRTEFHTWSIKSNKYDRRKTDARWTGYYRSPPTQIGAGTIFHMAREVSPDWEAAYFDRVAEEVLARNTTWEELGEAAHTTSKQNDVASTSEAPPEPDKPKPKSYSPLLKSSAQFVSGFSPPDYLVEGLLQRRFLYSLTAPTGFGKTCVTLRLAAHVALGRNLNDLEVDRGSVLYLAGENADDVRMRWIKLCEELNAKPDVLPVFFIDTREKLSSPTVRTKIHNETIEHGPFSLVVVDTSAAYFEGQDENDNVALGSHARMLRSLITEVAGGPTIVVTCHPPKNYDVGNLLPRGGGAFLAEVDGNLVLIRENMTLEMTWHGKFRGPDFPPLSFRLKTGMTQILKDSKGRPFSTVTAEPISAAEREAMDERSDVNLDKVLIAMNKTPGLSIRDIAKAVGWTYKNGEPNKSLVERIMKVAKSARLVEKIGRNWVLTKSGREAAAAAERRPL